MTPWERIVQEHDKAIEIKKAPPVRTYAKQCTVCKRFLSKDEFYAKPESVSGLRSNCKNCFIKARKKNVVPKV